MQEDLKEKIAEFFRNADDWKRMPTQVPGVFIIKTGHGVQVGRVKTPGLAIELNQMDEKGKPKRSRGLIIESFLKLAEYQRMVSDNIYKRVVVTSHGYGSMLTDQKILETIKNLLKTIEELGLNVK